MPTYQYACTECGHRFEAVQSFSDDALTDCPQCTGRLRKVFNSVGIVFKGSGFYRTDSREKAGAGTANGEAKPSEKADKPASADKPAASATPAASSTTGASTSSSSSGSSSTAGSAA